MSLFLTYISTSIAVLAGLLPFAMAAIAFLHKHTNVYTQVKKNKHIMAYKSHTISQNPGYNWTP